MTKNISTSLAILIAVSVTGIAFSNEPEWISVRELHDKALRDSDLSYDVQASYRCSALTVLTSEITRKGGNLEVSEQLVDLAIKRAGNALMLAALVSKKRGADVDPHQHVGDSDFIISVMQKPHFQDLIIKYANWAAYSQETTGDSLGLLADELADCKDVDAYSDLQSALYLRNSVQDTARKMGLSEEEINKIMEDAPALPSGVAQ
jgi:hypothetical protein